jgi:hypothetical protein
LKGDDIAKKIKFHKLSQMKQIVIKSIKINSKGRINEGLLSNFRGSAHKPRKREGKRGKRKSWPRQTKGPFETHSANRRDVVV